MAIGETFAVALKNLRHQRIRSFLTLAGVIIGIAAIVALISLGNGLNIAVTQQFEKLGMNSIYVEPGNSMGLETAIARTLTDRDVELLEDIQGVEVVIPFYETSGTAVHRNESEGVFILGFNPEHNDNLREMGFMDVEIGRELDVNDRYSVLVGRRFAEKAYEKELGLRSHIELEGKKFRVIGIVSDSGMSIGGISVGNVVYMHKDIIGELYGEEDPVEIQVNATTQEDVPAVVERIEYELEKDHGEKDFYVMSTEQILTGANMVIGIIQLVLVGIAAISLAVGGIGIMNTMFMSVMERTREIGIMKAIGATNKVVRNIFILEAGLIGAVGGVIGSAIGFGFSVIVSIGASATGFDLPVEFSLLLFAEAMLFALVVGMISGYIPARRASELDPVEALRYE